MNDDVSDGTYFGDVPVRDIPENIALVDAHPGAQALPHEQRVASV